MDDNTYSVITKVNGKIVKSRQVHSLSKAMQKYLKIRNKFEQAFRNGNTSIFRISVFDWYGEEILHISNEG